MAELKRWSIGLALLFSLWLDGTLSHWLNNVLPSGFTGVNFWSIVVGICLIGLVDDLNNREIIIALVIGLLADLYYLGFVGPYTVGLPLLMFTSQKIARFIPEVFVVRLIIVPIFYLLFTLLFWLIMTTAGVINVDLRSVFLGLLYNFILALILTTLTYPLWVRLARDYPFGEKLDPYH
ncbi:rod shape-determining protein MreD [Lactobacillus psittaci]|uniref:Uncharacterized protein n=1 Tax=Lactobacillus psittaci DSM 15354 TaxID=1122152 RepID=A0A0R1S300_9LACO|nr:rod shape-determining protein MreD [Lactobacillus psittaci]KRL63463.1 hypothetical protein FC23_GL000704 [Lactobacillus psittaci DSM 15354]